MLQKLHDITNEAHRIFGDLVDLATGTPRLKLKPVRIHDEDRSDYSEHE